MNPKRTFAVLALGLLSGAIACSSSSNTPLDARGSPTVTLLPDGDVLLAGGAQQEEILWKTTKKMLASAERYHPESGTWTRTGSMVEGRHSHTATVLSSGKVLVAGGFSENLENPLTTEGSRTSAAELYDPASGTWSRTGAMLEPRTGHAATLLMDGRVLVTGGYSRYGVRDTAEVYDPATGRWSGLASMLSPREAHAATLLPDGRVLVSGGINANDGHLSSVEVYDPAANTWSPTGLMRGMRVNHVATLLPNGKVLVTGSNSLSGIAEVYDPATGLWNRAGGTSEFTYRNAHTATSLPDGRVLVVGGYGTQGLITSVEIYSPEEDLWSSSSPLPEPRSAHSSVLLRDGRVLVVGGSTTLDDGAATPLNTVVTYDPGTDTWE
jgi:hypothetical protein